MEDITEGKSSLEACARLQVDLCHISIGITEANMFAKADIISTVEFDHTGNYLATGDKGGRVVLFERNETVCAVAVEDSCNAAADLFRKNLVNTNSTRNSNHMSPSLTISNRLRLRRRSTRSNGAKDKTPPTTSFPRMTRR